MSKKMHIVRFYDDNEGETFVLGVFTSKKLANKYLKDIAASNQTRRDEYDYEPYVEEIELDPVWD
tara:strand:- start:2835 stop:3029 length:195 start_codon:yes stop_codon:yes gene_type:complete